MIFPRKIVFGRSEIEQFKIEQPPRFSGKNVLLIVSETLHSKKIDMWLIDVFKSNKVNMEIYPFSQEPKISDIDLLMKTYKKKKIDLIIGFGGGSVMDIAKAFALCASQEIDCLYLLDNEFVGERNIELWLLPSTAGTGSEANNLAIINTQKGKQAIVSNSLLPDLVILQPDLLNLLPRSTKLFSLIDMLSHALESLIAKHNTPLTEFYSVGALKLIANYYKQYLSGAKNNDINSYMQEASLFAGFAFGSTGVHLIHAFAYALIEQVPMTHGHSISIVLPSILTYWTNRKSSQLTKIKEYKMLFKHMSNLLDNNKETIYNGIHTNIKNKNLLIRRVLENKRLMKNSLIVYNKQELSILADDIYDRIKSSKK